MTQAYRLPKQAPLVLFALARSVGWLGHALGQVTTGRLIRPVPAMSAPLHGRDRFQRRRIVLAKGRPCNTP